MSRAFIHSWPYAFYILALFLIWQGRVHLLCPLLSVEFGRGRMVPIHIFKKNSHNLSYTVFITKNLETFGLFDKPFVRSTYALTLTSNLCKAILIWGVTSCNSKILHVLDFHFKPFLGTIGPDLFVCFTTLPQNCPSLMVISNLIWFWLNSKILLKVKNIALPNKWKRHNVKNIAKVVPFPWY